MKKASFLLLFFILISTSLYSQEKTRLAVLDFQTNNIPLAEMKSIVNLISTLFYKSGEYTVIDMAQRVALLEEMEFSMQNCSELECQLEAGKMLAAQLIVVGDITQFNSKIIINIKILDVETAATTAAESRSYQNIDALIENLKKIVESLTGKKITSQSEPLTPSPTKARQNLIDKILPDKKPLSRERQLAKDWDKSLVYLQNPNYNREDKIKILEDFIDQYPAMNPYLKEAKKKLHLLKNDFKKYQRIYSFYRKGFETTSFAFSISNYGMGGRLDLFTINWQNLYWDIIKFQAMGWKNNTNTVGGFKWSSQFGFPLWFSEKTQLRIGTGPSWGFLYAKTKREFSEYNEKTDQTFRSYFNWAVEISFLVHLARFTAFQIGINADFPLAVRDNNSFTPETAEEFNFKAAYRPYFGGFIGFRF